MVGKITIIIERNRWKAKFFKNLYYILLVKKKKTNFQIKILVRNIKKKCLIVLILKFWLSIFGCSNHIKPVRYELTSLQKCY